MLRKPRQVVNIRAPLVELGASFVHDCRCTLTCGLARREPARQIDGSRSAAEVALMCGRYTLYCSADDIAQLIGARLSEHQLAAYRTSRGYNVAPSQLAPIVVLEDGERAIVPVQWGFHPAWARDDAPTPINARAETVFDKPFFRKAIRQRRCLVPTTGWYEWHAISRTEKQPYFIRPGGTEVFAFAGLWEPADAEPGRTFAIVVGQAASGIAMLHPRQPIVVPRDDYDVWLDPATPRERLTEILAHREANYDREPVDKRVGNPRNDDPSLLDGLTC